MHPCKFTLILEKFYNRFIKYIPIAPLKSLVFHSLAPCFKHNNSIRISEHGYKSPH